MRALIQRVKSASVEVEDKIVSEINSGLVVLLGITHDDDHSDIQWLAKKIVNLREKNSKKIAHVAYSF